MLIKAFAPLALLAGLSACERPPSQADQIDDAAGDAAAEAIADSPRIAEIEERLDRIEARLKIDEEKQ